MNRMDTYKTKGIIIKSRKQGEADRIITLISPDEGIFDAKIKGAFRMKSKLNPSCGHFCAVELTLAKGKVIDTVMESSLIRSSEQLEDDIIKVTYASLIAEVTYKMSGERQPDTRAYTLLDNALKSMEEGIMPGLVTAAFLIKRLYIDGLLPTMASCSKCGSKQDLGWFSAETGGCLCADCAMVAPGVLRMQEPSRELAIELYRSTWDEIRTAKYASDILEELLAALLSFICFRGDLRLRSAETLDLLKDELCIRRDEFEAGKIRD
ncbi:MAG TPA: DNA repair protein RecO [Bacillota bacterium]|mgnify:CR=1 FL=1|nr:DNA repair protein RecO [Bacillota bacterium]